MNIYGTTVAFFYSHETSQFHNSEQPIWARENNDYK